ncbi:MAG TPA: sulfite exporter TauE/SafE family protein [Xanthobacteraceae bacterium]|nr:sulfite exporter TauE/SafE family protein [Xanthobacteraceae bacterium]
MRRVRRDSPERELLFGYPLNELVPLVLMIVGSGLITGLLAGLLGIGGASVTVPALYELFRFIGVPEEVRMQLCIGTSLAIIVPISIRSFAAHRKRSVVLYDVLKAWAVPVLLGVISGAAIAYYAPAGLFRLVFMIFCYAVGLKYLVGRDLEISDRLPGRPALIGIGYFIGLISSLIGVAGGSLSTLFLTLYGETIHIAIATSSGLGVLISIPGTIGYIIAGWSQHALLPPFSIGYVSLLGLLLFAPASVLAAPYGAKLAHKMSRRNLEMAFGLFLILVATRFLISLL